MSQEKPVQAAQEQPAPLKPIMARDVNPPKVLISEAGLFNALPHTVTCERQLRLAQMILANEMSSAEFGEFQTIMSSLTIDKRTSARRITLILDPLTPSRAVMRETPNNFVQLQKGQTLDFSKPLFTPKDAAGANLVARCIDSSLAMLMVGDDKPVVDKVTNSDGQLVSVVMEPTYFDILIDNLALKLGSPDAHKKIVESLTETLGKDREKLVSIRAQLMKMMSPTDGTGAMPNHTPEQLEDITKLVDQINTIEGHMQATNESLLKSALHIYKSYLDKERAFFFDPANMQIVNTKETHALLDDSIMRHTEDGVNPMWSMALLGALASNEMISVRLIYHGDQDFSDLLRAPETELWAGSEQDLQVAEATGNDESRYEPSVFLERLVTFRSEALQYYREKGRKREQKVSSDTDEKSAFDTPTSPSSEETEETSIARFPKSATTTVQFWLPDNKLGEFFLGVSQIRAHTQLIGRRALNDKMGKNAQNDI